MENTPIKYASYVRKSSEDDNRQILSIPAQLSELERLAESRGLKIEQSFSESKSAKDPGRDEFNNLCRLIAERKIQGIVCWKLDRLARNTVDGGLLQHFLHRGLLKEIVTPERTYHASDSTFMTAFEFANSTQFVRDLSTNVKRGLRKRLEVKKIPTGMAAIGFMNDKTKDKGDRDWFVDKERFPILREMFTMYLSGAYSASQIHKWAIHEAKLTTPKHRSLGGKLVSYSYLCVILKNPIYAGFFYDNGERSELHDSLPRIITEEQHYKILRMIGRKHASKTQQHHQVVYSGYVFSPSGEFVGPDVKLQLICQCKHKFAYSHKTHCPKCGIQIDKITGPKYYEYIFYRNIAKNKRREKTKYIKEGEITKKFLSYVEENLLMSDSLTEWSKRHLRELNDSQIEKAVMVKNQIQKRLKQLEGKKTKYREMYSEGMMTREEYMGDVAMVDKEISQINTNKPESSDWLSKAEEITSIGQELKDIFSSSGNTESKRSILTRLGSNIIWDEENIDFVNTKAVQRLIDGLSEARRINESFEPKNIIDLSEQNPVFRDVCSTLLPR